MYLSAVFTEIARLTNNLCSIDLLGDPELRKHFLVSVAAPHMAPLLTFVAVIFLVFY